MRTICLQRIENVIWSNYMKSILALIVLILAASCVLSACSSAGSAPTPPAAKPDNSSVTAGVMTTSVDDDSLPTAPVKTSFAPDTKAIYCSFKVSGVAPPEFRHRRKQLEVNVLVRRDRLLGLCSTTLQEGSIERRFPVMTTQLFIVHDAVKQCRNHPFAGHHLLAILQLGGQERGQSFLIQEQPVQVRVALKHCLRQRLAMDEEIALNTLRAQLPVSSAEPQIVEVCCYSAAW